MLTEVRMPKLGMSMKKGKVERWLVAEGQPVEKDKPLFELVTDKVNAVVDAPKSGLLGRVLVAEAVQAARQGSNPSHTSSDRRLGSITAPPRTVVLLRP